MFSSVDEMVAAGWTPIVDEGLFELVGPLWRSPERHENHYGFLAEPRHRNGAGFVHGGMLMAAADRAMGSAARDSNRNARNVTVQLSYEFLDGARIGDFIDLRCEVMRRARSIVFTRATLSVGPEVIGITSAVWKVIRSDQSPQATTQQ